MTPRIVRGLAAASAIFVVLSVTQVSTQRHTASTDDWPTYNRTHAGDRFSPLTDITTANVARLRPVCTYDTTEQVSFQTGPVVVDGVMYLTSDRATFAIDAATCAVKWKQGHGYRPTTLGVNRGAAFDGGRVFRGAGTGHVLALDPRRASWRGTWN